MTLFALRYLLLCGLAGLLSAIAVILGVGEAAAALRHAVRGVGTARRAPTHRRLWRTKTVRGQR